MRIFQFSIFIAVLLYQNVALAEVDVPKYDVENYCKLTTAMFEKFPTFKESCIEAEKKAKSQIKNVWPHISDAEKNECIKRSALLGGGSYQGVIGCAGLIIMTKVIDGRLHVSP